MSESLAVAASRAKLRVSASTVSADSTSVTSAGYALMSSLPNFTKNFFTASNFGSFDSLTFSQCCYAVGEN